MASFFSLLVPHTSLSFTSVPHPCSLSLQAGYVSGMLAPVGIGIAGALLIVGALYSIRMIHRKRRNSFKHQRRRKARHTEVNRNMLTNATLFTLW